MSINFDGFFFNAMEGDSPNNAQVHEHSTTFQKNYNNDQFVLGDNFKIPMFLLPAELSSKGNASVQF